MPSANFTNDRSNFTVSDQILGGRTQAAPMGWSFNDYTKLYNAAIDLAMQDVPVGSPSVDTYQTCFSTLVYIYTQIRQQRSQDWVTAILNDYYKRGRLRC